MAGEAKICVYSPGWVCCMKISEYKTKKAKEKSTRIYTSNGSYKENTNDKIY